MRSYGHFSATEEQPLKNNFTSIQESSLLFNLQPNLNLLAQSQQVFTTNTKMSYPEYLDDMESQLASYLGEDPSTFFSSENATVPAPVDSLEELSYDMNGQFTWDDFLNEEGIETTSPPPITLEWNPTEADFYSNEIAAPPTVDEHIPEEPTQSSGQEEKTSTNIESENTNEQSVATPSQPEPQPEENTIIPDDDSLFGGSTSNDIEVPKINEKHQSEVLAQGANSTSELVADIPQHGDSAASAPVTSGVDLDNTEADDDNDSLFGDVDDSGLGDGSQPPENKLPAGDDAPNGTQADDVDDLFGSAFGDDFEAELEAELKKDSANAAAPPIPKHTGLHLPKPPRKVANSQGLHLPDPPRAIANPQALHLPAPPQKSVATQGLHLPEPPRVVASPQGLNLPVPPTLVANQQGLHLPSQPSATVKQQSGADISAPEETGDQEDGIASTRRRKVRASRIPRSDMSRPKGRGQAGKVLTQLSGPAPSQLPESEPSSSSGANDTAEKVTHLPRWAFGKYTSFSKPVAGSRYRKPNNSEQNPIPVEDEQESVENTNELANTQSQGVAQSDAKIVGAIDLTSDTGNDLVVDGSVQQGQDPNHIDGEDSTRPYENFQIPASGNDMDFTLGDNELLNSLGELNFPPVIDDAGPAPQLQTYQAHSSAPLEIAPPVAPQNGVLPPPSRMEDFSLYGQGPLASRDNIHHLQVPNVHGAGTFAYQPPSIMGQSGAENYQPASQPMQTGHFEQGSGYGLGDDMVQATPADIGGSNSTGLNDNGPKKRLSHERAEYSDPRVLMTYDEFKQIFPQEPTRGCFEVAIQSERAADAAIVARGGVPPQRPTIRKSIICTWSQVQHLNRIRAANGEKLFEPKPNAHKRLEAFKESLRRKRQERGEASESEDSDMEPEAKRLKIASGPVQHATYHVEQHSEQIPGMHPTQPSHPQVSAAVSHSSPDHGVSQGPHSQNMGQASAMYIHRPVAQSAKRKMVPEQLESFEFAEQGMGPTVKRPRIAAPSRENTKPMNDQSMAKEFADYVSERQSEYLKLRVAELKQLCKTRGIKHGNFNGLSKGGMVGVLVGQDVNRHPIYSRMHHQAQARVATGREHPIPGVGRMGGMNPPSVAANHSQQQLRVPNGWGIRQNLPAPNVGPAHGMGLNHHQRAPSQFPHTSDHRTPSLAPMRFGNSEMQVTNSVPIRGPSHGHSRPVNVGRAQQLHMNGSLSGLVNNGGQPQSSIRQAPQGPTMHPSAANSSARSQIPVSVQNSGYNNSGIHQNINGGRNNHTSTNAHIPAYGIAGDFGAGIYQPAVDDRRRKPRIVGQEAPSRVPRGNQRSAPKPPVNLPQPAMNNTARSCTMTQPSMAGRASGNIQMGHQANTLGGSQIPRPAQSGNMGGDPRRFMQNRPQGGLYSAPVQGLNQGVQQQHAGAQLSRPPYHGPPRGNPFDRQHSGPAPPR
ncbi:uncharacterized protein EAE98_006681 [Botrytis deweyae]|uniref:HMG box domain-containing protein n=1 Tax=Botrytis deweyae TaxID=2478750 RepID=A0ABQ7IK07_9HELO|nr:uncharacterized protein EAE98_006681 [Botrytis deweyae]KAF7926386.1 hypothetical protein EAE98_006681 [Botrytis deweyae]